MPRANESTDGRCRDRPHPSMGSVALIIRICDWLASGVTIAVMAIAMAGIISSAVCLVIATSAVCAAGCVARLLERKEPQ